MKRLLLASFLSDVVKAKPLVWQKLPKTGYIAFDDVFKECVYANTDDEKRSIENVRTARICDALIPVHDNEALPLCVLWTGELAVNQERVWIDEDWKAYLRPTFDGDTSGYIRADLVQAKDAEIERLRNRVQHLRQCLHSAIGYAGIKLPDWANALDADDPATKIGGE